MTGVPFDGLEPIGSDRYELAEGPVWLEETGELAWVDILVGALHRWSPAGGPARQVLVGSTLGAVAPSSTSGELIAATGEGFARILADGSLVPLNEVLVADDDQRMNDGRCDPAGHFVSGTTSLTGRPGTSRLYRLEDDGRATVLMEDLSVSNGLCWSVDGDTLFHVDTPRRAVTCWRYRADGPLPPKPMAVLDLSALSGSPDGMTMDADGNLWIAFWGGGCVRCLSTRGEVLDEIKMPVPQPTSCAFGGEDLATLFITTASYGLNSAALRGLDGAVFRCRPGVTGTPTQPWCPRTSEGKEST